MNYLLDTHTVLWWFFDPDRLGSRAKEAIVSSHSILWFSAASYWEMCIKVSLEKLNLGSGGVGAVLQELTHNRVRWLGIEATHCQQLIELPFHHRDPFDRLLIAQAKTLSASVLSVDAAFDSYQLERVWN